MTISIAATSWTSATSAILTSVQTPLLARTWINLSVTSTTRYGMVKCLVLFGGITKCSVVLIDSLASKNPSKCKNILLLVDLFVIRRSRRRTSGF